MHVITSRENGMGTLSGSSAFVRPKIDAAPYIWSTVAVAAAVAVGHVLTQLTTFPNLSMIS